MKRNNWQLSLVFNFLIYFLSNLLICPTLNSVTQIPHFGPQTTINSARYYRPDSFNRIYNNRRNLQELQLATELAVLHNLNSNLLVSNYSPTTSSTTAPDNINTNTSSNSKSDSQNLQIYPDSYNPFAHSYLSETYYNLRTFLNSRYREAQETKYPYLNNSGYILSNLISCVN